MSGVLHISAKVLTGEALAAQHQGETELAVDPASVLTPTAWDYIRRHRLTLSRLAAGAVPAVAAVDDAQPLPQLQQAETPVQEVGPTAASPADEFGSGFAEPTSCSDCAIHALLRQGDTSCSCGGCNRHRQLEELVRQGKATPAEELVREITARINGD
jgi:hypothetical protein